MSQPRSSPRPSDTLSEILLSLKEDRLSDEQRGAKTVERQPSPRQMRPSEVLRRNLRPKEEAKALIGNTPSAPRKLDPLSPLGRARRTAKAKAPSMFRPTSSSFSFSDIVSATADRSAYSTNIAGPEQPRPRPPARVKGEYVGRATKSLGRTYVMPPSAGGQQGAVQSLGAARRAAPVGQVSGPAYSTVSPSDIVTTVRPEPSAVPAKATTAATKAVEGTAKQAAPQLTKRAAARAALMRGGRLATRVLAPVGIAADAVFIADAVAAKRDRDNRNLVADTLKATTDTPMLAMSTRMRLEQRRQEELARMLDVQESVAESTSRGARRAGDIDRMRLLTRVDTQLPKIVRGLEVI